MQGLIELRYLFSSGCRADASEAAIILLPSNITVFTLDFSGSGLSEGEHVTLGWNEVSLPYADRRLKNDTWFWNLLSALYVVHAQLVQMLLGKLRNK